MSNADRVGQDCADRAAAQPGGSGSSRAATRIRRVLVASVVLLVAVCGTFDSGSRTETHDVLKVELGGVCGTLVGAGITAAGFAKEAMTKVRGGWAGAAIAAGCLMYDLKEYSRKYKATPQELAQLAEIKRRWGSYKTYDQMMTDGFGCKKIVSPPINPDDVDSQPRSRWNCDDGPYGKQD